ncbi:NAD(P)H-hydrate dehydratase [Stappia sp. F7233]|uniref:Bifunctional NAD(P)H-hydrate repair enzyme n=1 Tax=Stappia albiluteola TaxID=2758565 RepID=A0A839ACV0_9HYPH|nr:NAD(P)H-hydrate dehydratase [Stappia albiluteola]MBA5776489.1 NAD(P)H-hydrate dehydratase [Stappia albiluteola]
MEVLLTTEDMARADRLTIESGVPGIELLNAAGRAVANCCTRMVGPDGRILVLAGPGNNGGDGFVAAEVLKKRGFIVSCLLLGSAEKLRGDAKLAFDSALAKGVDIAPIDLKSLPEKLEVCGLIVDALFGAGLDRPLSGEAAEVVGLVNASGARVVAVDLPSGVSGDSGAVMGAAVRATRTVTFFRRKPGHYLLPGRLLCGPVDVEDIGIPQAILGRIDPGMVVNEPSVWSGSWHPPAPEGHKYSRGHAVVVSGPATATGAARLAAMAALRAGAGLVTVACPSSAALVQAAHLTAVMIRSCRDEGDFAEFLGDRRINAAVIGPAAGVGARTREKVAIVLGGCRSVVLDADALMSFADGPQELFEAIAATRPGEAVMTPHEGEFARLFPDLSADMVPSKAERARQAAQRSGAVILLKGGDTVIAAPDGRVSISPGATPWLATAGSGDVLAGIVGGLLAQRLPAFEAAAMGVWLHGEAGRIAGPGLIAEDLLPALKTAVAELVRDA